MLQRSEASSIVHNPSRSTCDGCSARPGLEPSPALTWRRWGWRTSQPAALVTGIGCDRGGVGARKEQTCLGSSSNVTTAIDPHPRRSTLPDLGRRAGCCERGARTGKLLHVGEVLVRGRQPVLPPTVELT
jgi:hypothetical protein